MIPLADFHFLRPEWFLALIPLLLLLLGLAGVQRERGNWGRVCDPALLDHLLIGRSSAGSTLSLAAVGLAGLLGITALAGPAWHQLPQSSFRDEAATVVALDLSRSMYATDIQPSRLERARFKVRDMLKRTEGGRTALLVYAAEPHVIVPLSDDPLVIDNMIPLLDPDILPAQGSRLDRALEAGADLLAQGGAPGGQIIVVTDGVADLAAALSATRKLRSQGYRVSVLGIGTTAGGPIPAPQGGFIRDRGGKPVVSELKEDALREIAGMGGGRYARISVDDADIRRVMERDLIGALASKKSLEEEVKADTWRDEGIWLVLALLPFGLLMFRRGALFSIALLWCSLSLDTPTASADTWDDLWLRKDQQARRAMEGGDSKTASKLFEDPAWKGTAQYKDQRFNEAITTLQAAEGETAKYNLGNALAHAGRLPEALQAYQEVLEANPDHEDAKFNQELVAKMLAQQNQPQRGESADNAGDSRDSEDSQDQQGGLPQQGEQQNQRQPDQQQAQQNSQQTAGQQQQQDQPQHNQQQSQQQQAAAEEQERHQQATEQESQPRDQSDQQVAHRPSQQPLSEDDQAVEQWLSRVPDDPGGLLREKLRRQYQQRRYGARQESEPW